jgi:hypothetical protein
MTSVVGRRHMTPTRVVVWRVRRLLVTAAALFLPCAAVVAVACGVAYVEVQQDLRSNANDPQIQLAEDAAVRLNAGAKPADVVPGGSVDVATSLAPFITIDDASGHVLATSGTLDGQPPAPPGGVLDAARTTGRDVVTWQPRPGVRVALVAVPWRDGVVLAGRSLRLVEQREDNALLIAVAAGITGLAALGAASLVGAGLLVRR